MGYSERAPAVKSFCLRAARPLHGLAASVLFVAAGLAAGVAAAAAPIFVLNSQDANVSVIDPVTWAELQRIPTGKEPHHIYLTPDEKSLLVANATSDTLTFLDPRTARCSAP